MVTTPNGTTSNALVLADMAHVVWAVNLGCLGFHVWPTHCGRHGPRRRAPHRPRPVARRQLRDDPGGRSRRRRGSWPSWGSTCFPKTTGNRGVHVYVRLEPRWDSYDVAFAAVALARELERRRGDLVTAAWWKEERGDPGLHRLQPERTAQDGVRGVVGAGASDGQRVDAAAPGTSSTTSFPTTSPSSTVPERRSRHGRPVGRDDTTIRSRSSHCSSCTSRTGPRGSPMRPGHRSTRRCPTRRPA